MGGGGVGLTVCEVLQGFWERVESPIGESPFGELLHSLCAPYLKSAL